MWWIDENGFVSFFLDRGFLSVVFHAAMVTTAALIAQRVR
jgi:hypothetical protein